MNVGVILLSWAQVPWSLVWALGAADGLHEVCGKRGAGKSWMGGRRKRRGRGNIWDREEGWRKRRKVLMNV